MDPSGVHLWLVLMKAHRAVERYSMRSIQRTGMCFSDFAVLEILLHKGPLPVNTIGAKIPLTSGSTTTAIDRLATRGLVRRSFGSKDRRTRIVHLTSKGGTLIQEIFAKHNKDLDRAGSLLTSNERVTLIQLLKKLGIAAEELADASNQSASTA